MFYLSIWLHSLRNKLGQSSRSQEEETFRFW